MTMIDKILFIDDDNICSFINVALVEELGIAKEVESIQRADEALNYILEEYSAKPASSKAYPDLIFLDINMPEMDGFELLQQLEEQKNIDKSRFLIILLSASLHPADQEKAACHSDMVFACLSKPLAEEDVQKLLTDMFAH